MKTFWMGSGFAAVAAMLLCGVATAQPTTYQYVGTYYTNPTGTLTTSMRITGSFTTANPLPPNMPPTAIGPGGDGRAIAWSFFNGIDTFTQANSSELYGITGYFSVGTDDLGNISYYNIGLVAPLPPHTVGGNNDFFWIAKATAVQALDNATCANVDGSNQCVFMSFSGAGTYSIMAESGRFLPNFAKPAAPVPLDARWALAGLALALMVLGARRARSPRPRPN